MDTKEQDPCEIRCDAVMWKIEMKRICTVFDQMQLKVELTQAIISLYTTDITDNRYYYTLHHLIATIQTTVSDGRLHSPESHR